MVQKLILPVVLAFFFVASRAGAADEELTIGWIGPLTGNAAPLGIDSVLVARQIFEKHNESGEGRGPRIKFVAEDDEYRTAKTLAAYSKLVHADGAKAIFVLTHSGLLAIAERAEKDNVLLIDPTDCDDEIAALPQNTICVAKFTEDLAAENARHAVRHKRLPAAILYYEGDSFPVKLANTTKRTLEREGASIAAFEGIPGATRDFRSAIGRAKQRGVKSIFVYGYDDFGLALKQARDLGVDAALYSVPGAGIGNPGFNAGAGEAINGVFSGGWFAPRVAAYDEFIGAYTAANGRKPLLDVSTVPTYDVATLLVSAIRAAEEKGAPVTMEILRNFLYNTKDYAGLSGKITVDADGAVRTLPVGMHVYDRGEFQRTE